MLITVRNLFQKQLLMKKAANSFTAIVAVATTITEMARDGYTLQPLTTVSHTVPTTRSLNLTSYLANSSLQVGGAVCVRGSARARNRSTQKRKSEKGCSCGDTGRRQRRHRDIKSTVRNCYLRISKRLQNYYLRSRRVLPRREKGKK